MRNDNYPSSSEVVRNLSQIRVHWETLHTEGKFRVVKIDPPFFDGFEFWIVNERGFLWEPALDLGQVLEYLESDEARSYNDGD